ncbi:o-succinylbenzoate synthase [Roseofilum sp. BLCC_M91]|uniref:o-succinylbenzoate synthase n=1 Tax=Roseofilum halophilum BLCC-M91 TaxID=3022259 RepID=A0ABT7BLR9_9CYAN|nr:o-succinylbenzoate synthase [Roseofilum halophilum]MDJ1180147.1 o-succinylbenzoate synthase [Roseofilum halophilum BLCC-M91]
MGINFHNSQNKARYQVRIEPYSRRFKQPLQTHHGLWRDRQGIWIQLCPMAASEAGECGWGEIAPLPEFGSENLTEALHFCQSLRGEISPEEINSIPDDLPACQFGFESALMDLHPLENPPHLMNICGLLPTGKAALDPKLPIWNQGYATLKWKIAVTEISQELALFQDLLWMLPEGVKLRLDANGGLTEAEAHQWLQACEHQPVEFLEQPLGRSEFEAMLALSHEYETPLALDESIATWQQFLQVYHRGWPSIMVIKPAIFGFPSRLIEFCHAHPVDIVLSSVFETAIARKMLFRLATTLPNLDRALGLGTDRWFEDGGMGEWGNGGMGEWGDTGRWRRGDAGTRGHGEMETRGRGDAGTRGDGDAKK